MSDFWEDYALQNYNFFNFPPRALVLDIGCGSGEQLDELIRRGFVAFGVEPYGPALTQCRARHLCVVQGSAVDMPVKAGSVDGLVLKGVLCLTDEIKCLREMGRILRTKGTGHCCYLGAGYYLRYVFIAPSWKFRVYGLRTLLNTWWHVATGLRLPGFLGDTVYQSLTRLQRHYKESGLRLVKDTPAPSFLGFPVFFYHAIEKVAD